MIINRCPLVPSLLEGSGVLLTFICPLRQGDWRLFSRRQAALRSEKPQQNENRRQQGDTEEDVQQDLQLTRVCEKVLVPEWRPSSDFWLLCGVPLRGETYGRGDEASDVRDTGDWLECWAETGTEC